MTVKASADYKRGFDDGFASGYERGRINAEGDPLALVSMVLLDGNHPAILTRLPMTKGVISMLHTRVLLDNLEYARSSVLTVHENGPINVFEESRLEVELRADFYPR